MKSIANVFGNVVMAVLKFVLKVIITVLQLILETVKIMLLLGGLVMKIFLSFVKAATP